MFFTIFSERLILSASDSQRVSWDSSKICPSLNTVLIGAASRLWLDNRMNTRAFKHMPRSGGKKSDSVSSCRPMSSISLRIMSFSESGVETRTHRSSGWFCLFLQSSSQKALQKEESFVMANQLLLTALRVMNEVAWR